MYNYVMLLGNFKKKNDKYYMSITRPFRNSDGVFETDEIPITVPQVLTGAVEENCIDKYLGIKGRIRCTDEQVEIVAESFILDPRYINDNK